MGEQFNFGTLSDKATIEAAPIETYLTDATVFDRLSRTAADHADRPAVSFQIKSGPGDKAETLSWRELRAEVIRTANLLRDLGVGQDDEEKLTCGITSNQRS